MIEPMDGIVNDEKVAIPELAEAIKKFNEAFAERSFSQRHEELGKMIDCRLCGCRHREGDPLAKLSRAHGEQKKEMPASRAALFHKQRFHPHHNSRIHQFAQLAEKIYTQDIAPYFHDEGDRLIRRAQRRAAIILRKQWIAARVLHKHAQDISRRINWCLLPGGSR
jgi:hypothetical protein